MHSRRGPLVPRSRHHAHVGTVDRTFHPQPRSNVRLSWSEGNDLHDPCIGEETPSNGSCISLFNNLRYEPGGRDVEHVWCGRMAWRRWIQSSTCNEGMRMAQTWTNGKGNHQEYFDRTLKRIQRDRVAWRTRGTVEDPLQREVAKNVLDRLKDCKDKNTEHVVVLGGAASSVLAELHAEWREKIRRITVVDLSRNMLQKYRDEMHDRKPEMPARRFYVQGDEEFLPLKPSSADVIISCLGMHWVNDLPGALRQIRHVLKPDGLFLGAMLGGETLCELRIACLLAEQEVEGGVSPRVSPFARVNDAGSVLTAAGYTLAAVDVDTIMMRYEHPKQLVEHLRDMGETNAQKLRRSYIPKKTLDVSINKYIDQFQEDDGSVPATFEVIFMTGWAPHASQQKPARRGSATVSIKDIDKLTDGKEPSPPSQ